ncbi:MAG: DUF1616 domain-containing protein [Methanobacteriota archaeon]
MADAYRAGRPADPTDLLVALGLVAGGAIALAFLPAGSWARLLVAVPVLLVAPGYLFLQAVAPRAATAEGRVVEALLSVGVSPCIVGLAALATALVPGGFRPLYILAAVTGLSALLAAAATLRRALSRAAAPAVAPRDDRQAAEKPAPEPTDDALAGV